MFSKNIEHNSVEHVLDENERNTQTFVSQDAAKDELCVKIAIGDKQYNVCSKYAEQQSEFFKSYIKSLGDTRKPLISWSYHCGPPKHGYNDSIQSSEELRVNDIVAENIFLITTYSKSKYKPLSLQDMICLLDHFFGTDKKSVVNIIDIPDKELFMFCLQSIVILNVESLNLLFILVGTFKEYLLRLTSREHLLSILLNGVRSMAILKDNWWSLILFVDYYFFKTTTESNNIIAEQTKVIEMIKDGGDSFEWRNQIIYVIAQSMGYYYGSVDIITLQSMLNSIFVHSCNKIGMKSLFDSWVSNMDNRLNYAIKNMVICFLVRNCSMVVIKVGSNKPVPGGSILSKRVGETYSCTRSDSGWKVTYSNSNSIQYIQSDNSFSFLQTMPWNNLNVVGMTIVRDDNDVILGALGQPFSADVDLDGINLTCRLDGREVTMMQWFYHLPMTNLLDMNGSNFAGDDTKYRLPFTDKQLAHLFSTIILKEKEAESLAVVDLFA